MGNFRNVFAGQTAECLRGKVATDGGVAEGEFLRTKLSHAVCVSNVRFSNAVGRLRSVIGEMYVESRLLDIVDFLTSHAC